MTDEILKVILIDDEYLVRDLLKKCVDWTELGMMIVGEASNANEAMLLVDKFVPDIIFTDICMPSVDGIELSKMVIEKYPAIKIVIITGYEDFDYVKRSLKAGVTDYLLKPINDDEIKKVALHIKSKIMTERKHWDEYRRLKKQLADDLPYLKEKFLNELLISSFSEDEIKEKLEYYQINIIAGNFQTSLCEIAPLRIDSREEENLILQLQCIDLIRRHFEELPRIHVFFDNRHRIVILSNNDAINISEYCQNLKMTLLSQYRCSICIGIGGIHSGVKNIGASYREACNALKYRILFGKNQVINHQDTNLSISDKWSLSNDQIDIFVFYLKAGMKEQVLKTLETFFIELSNSQKITIDLIRVLASNLISIILNVIAELGINITEISHNTSQPYENVFKVETLPEMLEYIQKFSVDSTDIINNLRRKKVNKVIKEIQDYLITNYNNSELSLSGVAKHFFLNPSYLSRIFKQETNQTFIEYLTGIRMDRAISLFKDTDLKVYQIAERVGITDPHYFSICFKKYTGKSVNDYKKYNNQ